MVAHAEVSPERYEVVRRLGAGGMGEVLLGRQRMAGGVFRAVVLKTMLPHMAESRSNVDLFLREARLVASLSHPNVVQILDITEHNGTPCIVMEYLRGADLSVVLRRGAKTGVWPSPATTAAMIAQAADGLHHAHAHVGEDDTPRSIIHRDVSPQNLFVSRDGAVKVLDFGIARSTADPRTQTGVLRGKLAYMAPEQLDGSSRSAIGPRTDQFALGVVLWECLARRRLYQRPSPIETMKAVVSMKVPPPSTLSGSPAVFDPIVLRALSRDPKDRWPSCNDLSAALREAARGLGSATTETELVRAMVLRTLPEATPSGPTALSGTVGVAAVANDDDDLADHAASTQEDSDEDETWLATYVPPTEAAPEAAVTRPAPVGGRTAWALGALLIVLAVGAVAWRLGSHQAGSDAPSEPVLEVHHESPPTPHTAAAGVISVRFEGLPAGARLELDGRPLEGGLYRGPPLDVPHQVRVLRGDEVLWSAARALTTDETVVLALAAEAPATPPATLVTPAAPARPPHAGRRSDRHVLVRDYPTE